jgi:hypothetical protein
MMIRKATLLTALIAIALPQSALAYLSPEDVLLNRDLFMPPSAREAQERNALQTEESSARREREQERAFALQHPEPEYVEPLQAAAPVEPTMPAGYMAVPINGYYGQPMFGAAPAQGGLDSASLELQRTMRLLGRVNQNQVASQFQAQMLHSSADDLAPTGAGTVLSLMAIMGAVVCIIRRTKNVTAVIEA